MQGIIVALAISWAVTGFFMIRDAEKRHNQFKNARRVLFIR